MDARQQVQQAYRSSQGVNLIETTVIGTVSAIVGGAVAWMTRGKFQADSLQVKQAQAVLAMWQATAEAQNKELTQLRNEVVALRQRIECLENTIQVLEAENANLRNA
jgi:septal ring factor EnvC (AmiA/AmiB activator)